MTVSVACAVPGKRHHYRCKVANGRQFLHSRVFNPWHDYKEMAQVSTGHMRVEDGTRVRSRRLAFSLIEVVLGLGLIAFGIISILGLFPVGLTATRDAISESYAADSVDEFLHILASRLKDPTNDFANWNDFGVALPTTKPSDSEPQNWTVWISQDTTTLWYGGLNREFYRVEQRGAGAQVPDFDAVYRLWRSPVTISRFEDGAWIEGTVSEDVAMAINVEASWPVRIPYARRGKALYRLEVYRSD